ncbi:MAG: hypothetical protein V4640_13935 [Verrucomicrobiota bacterium]
MKRSTLIPLLVGTAITAFVLARWTSRDEAQPVAESATNSPRRASARTSASDRHQEPPAKEIGKYPPAFKGMTEKQAVDLTSEERMALLAQGILLSDWGNQASVLCGLIRGLHKNELSEATKMLQQGRQSGNGQPEVIWQTLWQQWGRLDPETAFTDFGKISTGESTDCARNVMEGWLEANADRALEWAQTPKSSPEEGAAAALAISRNANGDPKQLVAAMRKLPADGATAKACLDDYFDLSSLAPESPSAAEIYDQLDPELRPTAWSVAAKRLSLGEASAAKDWFTAHAADPGRNYASMTRFFFSQANDDAAGTLKWVTQLPYDASRDGQHPAARVIEAWRYNDPAAAKAWLATQPTDSPWVSQ